MLTELEHWCIVASTEYIRALNRRFVHSLRGGQSAIFCFFRRPSGGKRQEVARMRKALKTCRHAGCRKLTRSGWCDDHRPTYQRGESSEWHRLYNLPIWRELRGNQLISEPWCQNPTCYGLHQGNGSRPARASVVDHVTPHRGDMGLFADPNNLQSLCKPCHDRKTAKERAGIAVRSRGW